MCQMTAQQLAYHWDLAHVPLPSLRTLQNRLGNTSLLPGVCVSPQTQLVITPEMSVCNKTAMTATDAIAEVWTSGQHQPDVVAKLSLLDAVLLHTLLRDER